MQRQRKNDKKNEKKTPRKEIQEKTSAFSFYE